MEFASDDQDAEMDVGESYEQDLLDAAVDLVRKLAKQAVEADEELDKAKHELVDLMASREQKTSVAENDGVSYRVTVVSSERAKIDDEGLRKAIGARAWNKLTKRVTDAGLLATAVTDGVVDAKQVAANVTITRTKAYPKISREGN